MPGLHTLLWGCVPCSGALYTAPRALHCSRGSIHCSKGSALLWGSVQCTGGSIHCSKGSVHCSRSSVHHSKGSVHCSGALYTASRASAHCHLAVSLKNCWCCRGCCPLPSSRSLPTAAAASLPRRSLRQHLRDGRSLPVSPDTPASARAQQAQHRWPFAPAAPGRPLGDPCHPGGGHSGQVLPTLTSSQGRAVSLPATEELGPALPRAISCCT